MKTWLEPIGVGTDTPVVCYDSADGLQACRAAFLLSSHGVKNVHVLSWTPS